MAKILFIDDDMKKLQFFVEFLKLEGYEVDYVESDIEATEYIKSSKDFIDLVILDVIMPSKHYTREQTGAYRRTGIIYYTKITDMIPNVPILVMTVIDDDEELEKQVLKMGAQAYLKKGKISPTALSEKIKNILSKAVI
ncbi:MAG: response regulator [candidate division Zixibacteria bacterium]|nr:response regulator [candidate division Zixibacteria bacterium]